MEIVVSIIAGLFSICVAIFGAIIVNICNVKLETRKLKEDHYVRYLEAVHNLAEENTSSTALKEYTLHRDKMFIVANEKVITAMLEYEKAAEKTSKERMREDEHDKKLTRLVKEIRKDLGIRDKKYPQIQLRVSKKQ